MIDVLVMTYFALALGYNIVSQLLLDAGGKKLAPTDPAFGLLFVGSIYLLVLIKPFAPSAPVMLLSGVWLAAVLRFGVIKHILNYSPEEYLSRLSWAAAFSINIFGILVLSYVFFFAR